MKLEQFEDEDSKEQRAADKEYIKKLGHRLWDSSASDLETILHTKNPMFFERSDKRMTDLVAHIKNKSQAAIAAANALEKASKMRNGIVGGHIPTEEDDDLTAEKLLELVRKQQEVDGKSKN